MSNPAPDGAGTGGPAVRAVRRWPAWALLCAGLALTVMLTLWVKQGLDADARDRYAHASDHIALQVRERLESYELALIGARALFAGSHNVTRDDWRQYVSLVLQEPRISSAQGIGYALLIAPGQLAAHIAKVRAEGYPDYAVRPPGARDTYTAIVFLEPFKDRNLRAFGYDMYSEPVRRDAMARARDSGQAQLSGKVRLVQETDSEAQAGVLMYVPVYRQEMPLQTVEQRRAALLGWAYSPYRMNDLMRGILGDWQGALGVDFDLHVYDGEQASPQALLYASDAASRAAPHPHEVTEMRRLDFNGRRWRLEFRAHSLGDSQSYASVWRTLAGGFAISVLMCWLALSLIGTRELAVRIAAGLTADIRSREAQLKESELRWKFALEGSDLGVWDWDIERSTVLFSRIWKQMLGHAEGEIGNSLDEWKSRVHPDDLPATLAAVQAYLEGKAAAYENVHRVRCKDGSYKWILDRGMVVERTPEGSPLRMIGTHSDVTQLRTLSEDLQRSRDELEEAQRLAKVGHWKLDLPTGQLDWSAELHRMMGFDPQQPDPQLQALTDLFSAESWARLEAAIARTRESGEPYAEELEFRGTDGSMHWMLTRGEALRDEDGGITRLRGVAADITERKRAELRLRRISRLYAALSEANAAVLHCADEQSLFRRICEVVVELGGMDLAWIGLVDAASHRILPVAAHGHGLPYLEGIVVSVDPGDPHGRGPTGTATRENHPIWFDDFRTDPRTAPWRERAAQYGWASSAALPIVRSGRPCGALTFYATDYGWTDAETRALLEEIATAIGYALDKFDAEASEAASHASLLESEQRFLALVGQSIAGAFISQDRRFVYANPRLAQILGYEDESELLGLETFQFIAEKDRARAEEALRSLNAGDQQRAELMFTALRKDGSTTEVGIHVSRATYRQSPCIIGLLQDISDKKVAEEQIRRYTRQLENAFMQTVALATTLSEMRDPYTAGHEQRVAEIAVAIGTEMGLDAHKLEGLKVGGYLHDVGKTAIPTEILAKPGKLTPLEYELIKSHAAAGYAVLKDVEFPWPVAQIALQHHERMDGSGYPRGLKGEEILLEARIVAVADVVESMGSHRPYRAALGIEPALAEIARGRGALYDPVVADACLRLFRDKGYQLKS